MRLAILQERRKILTLLTELGTLKIIVFSMMVLIDLNRVRV